MGVEAKSSCRFCNGQLDEGGPLPNICTRCIKAERHSRWPGPGEDRWNFETEAATRLLIARAIRAELVCCDIYDKAHGNEAAVQAAEESGHGICFWGEAAARLANPGVPPPGTISPSGLAHTPRKRP